MTARLRPMTRPLTDPALLLPHGKAVAFDLETTGSDRLWTDEPGSHVRLGGWAVGGGDVLMATDQGLNQVLVPILGVAGVLAGHNIMAYDLLALHRHHGFPTPWQLLEKGMVLHDTQLTEALLDPPRARWSAGEAMKYYSLDAVSQRHGLGGKPFNLKQMAQHYARLERNRDLSYTGAGFELIPLTHPDFLEYLRQDVVQTRMLAREQRQSWSPYIEREHKIAAIAAQISINGFRVDVPELERRVKQGQRKRHDLLQELIEVHGLPTVKADGKPAKNPAMTKDGKLAIVTAFDAAGVPTAEFRFTQKMTSYDLSKDYMEELIQLHPDSKVSELAELVMELNGVRPIYDTIQQHLAGDRVHPSISLRQASGRWSITKPGLTVVGKRGGRVQEREVFLAEPGEVVLSVDLSQVDARAVAAFCQDENYMSLFDEGRDPWTEMAERFGISRDAVKVIGHGANYGMGVDGTLRHNPTLTRDEVERFHRERREQFPGLIRWQDEVREQARTELLDNGFGRKLRVDPERAYTQAPALMGQSAARDIMCEGLLRLDPALHTYLRLWVHDELILSVPAQSAQDLKEEVTRALSFDWAPPGADRPIQIRAEATIGGSTWASAYEAK